jgi:hypothetical protein
LEAGVRLKGIEHRAEGGEPEPRAYYQCKKKCIPDGNISGDSGNLIVLKTKPIHNGQI